MPRVGNRYGLHLGGCGLGAPTRLLPPPVAGAESEGRGDSPPAESRACAIRFHFQPRPGGFSFGRITGVGLTDYNSPKGDGGCLKQDRGGGGADIGRRYAWNGFFYQGLHAYFGLHGWSSFIPRAPPIDASGRRFSHPCNPKYPCNPLQKLAEAGPGVPSLDALAPSWKRYGTV